MRDRTAIDPHSLYVKGSTHEGSEEVEDGVGGDGEEGEGVKAVERVNGAVVEPRHTAHHHMTGRVTSSLHHHENSFTYITYSTAPVGRGKVLSW